MPFDTFDLTAHFFAGEEEATTAQQTVDTYMGYPTETDAHYQTVQQTLAKEHNVTPANYPWYMLPDENTIAALGQEPTTKTFDND